jgi:hypothetical protein
VKCDRCPAAARERYVDPEGRDVLLCKHHADAARVSLDELVRCGWAKYLLVRAGV